RRAHQSVVIADPPRDVGSLQQRRTKPPVARLALGLATLDQQLTALALALAGEAGKKIKRRLVPTPRLIGSELLERVVAGSSGSNQCGLRLGVARLEPMPRDLRDRSRA